ncbi:uncharacterized protein J7T55_015612 [Diaporthe amygdali]|uniref:uncharacterized protein n=1 Tax=Phomopsis amygdali TaxID=1214568 RepID=UPI0022FED737|nr:uncharacterized protein J7T55_015612 [Diaporthe amygdali]KAJ0120876.1 uncharacterized protein J7T55_015612 [Diaporthe amygdali]
MVSLSLLSTENPPYLLGDVPEMLRQYLAGISVHWPDFSQSWADFSSWLSQPHILAVVLAWWITFTVICTIILVIGFGPAGVIAGTAAAAFQSFMYGGFTPAGGLFATLTSMAMVGTLVPACFAISLLIASLVAAMVWVYGVGR